MYYDLKNKYMDKNNILKRCQNDYIFHCFPKKFYIFPSHFHLADVKVACFYKSQNVFVIYSEFSVNFGNKFVRYFTFALIYFDLINCCFSISKNPKNISLEFQSTISNLPILSIFLQCKNDALFKLTLTNSTLSGCSKFELEKFADADSSNMRPFSSSMNLTEPKNVASVKYASLLNVAPQKSALLLNVAPPKSALLLNVAPIKSALLLNVAPLKSASLLNVAPLKFTGFSNFIIVKISTFDHLF